MRILVTGGAGFIGSTLVDLLLDNQHDVHVVDDFSRGSETNLAAPGGGLRCPVHRVDIRSGDLAGVVSEAAPEVIMHLAAQIDVRTSVTDPLGDADKNVLGTLNVAEAARRAGVRKVVFASSGGSIYGVPDQLPVDERAPLCPESPYATSKISGEFYLNTYRRLHGLDCTHLALANVYGPRQDPHGEAGVVAIFAGALLEGRPTSVFGDGGNTRDYVYVGDVARAFLAAAGERGGGCRYHIGTGGRAPGRGVDGPVTAAPAPHERARKCSTVRATPSATVTSGFHPIPASAAVASRADARTSPLRAGANAGSSGAPAAAATRPCSSRSEVCTPVPML